MLSPDDVAHLDALAAQVLEQECCTLCGYADPLGISTTDEDGNGRDCCAIQEECGERIVQLRDALNRARLFAPTAPPPVTPDADAGITSGLAKLRGIK